MKKLRTATDNLESLLAVVSIGVILLCAPQAPAAQDGEDNHQEQENKSKVQQTPKDIERLVMQVLADTDKRRDPFVKAERQQQRTVATYEIQERPRPQSGLGRYDIDELDVTAIWKETDRIVAMIRAPDEKLFVANVGDEAFDGMIVEISIEGKYVKFMQKLQRVGPQLPGQPDVKFEPKIVWLSR